MADIVTRLRRKVHYPCSRDFAPRDEPCEACEDREEAADEIERLRAAGDALLVVARGLRFFTGQSDSAVDAAFSHWREARRG